LSKVTKKPVKPLDLTALTAPLEELHDCSICSRECHADRFSGKLGWCRSDASFNIASICIHRGEEPAISGKEGIINIFFSHCNLQCLYCQNHQISANHVSRSTYRMDLPEVIRQIAGYLDQGIPRVGFVSPSHFIPHVRVIIAAVKAMGYDPVWIYNTNGFDKMESLRGLEGLIDVYLPDLKYSDPALARDYSGAAGYPETAARALKEMFRQKGTALITGDDDTAVSGIIVRHLVLPGAVENSIGVLKFLAEELSPKIHVSLMAQYYPTRPVAGHPTLGRSVTEAEYRQVVDAMEALGMYHGWIQEFDSSDFYRPDFDQDHPFEM